MDGRKNLSGTQPTLKGWRLLPCKSIPIHSKEDSLNILCYFCFFAWTSFLAPPKTNQCEWRKMCWYAVTRLVSSILGCQEPRFSFQIATIVVLKSRPPTTNQPQWGGQGSNADRNIRQKFPYNRAPANTLLIGCFFTG